MVESEGKLERYELVERIAVGGMAEVFRAKSYGSHGFEKVVAIKRILPELAADAEFEHRFINEAKIAVTLTHANIVQVLDFSRFGESLYIVMEYIDGIDLAGLLSASRERDALIPIEAALHIAIELLKGLEFAHDRDVVHRDISPSNILISRAGEVKIGDFGIAQAAGHGSGRMRVMGKWRYMSPEQTEGDALDARSDLFSAATVMFECFTGERLFRGDNAEDIIRAIHRQEIPAACGRRPELPAGIDDVLRSALVRDPEDRIAGAGEFLHRLIDISYASALKATATSLAEVVAPHLSAPADGRDSPEQSAQLIDDIINSELGHSGNTPGRITARAAGPPPLLPEDEHRTSTGPALVRRRRGEDGVTEWVLERVEDESAGRGSGEPADLDSGEAVERGPSRRRRSLVGLGYLVGLLLGALGIYLATSGGGARPPGGDERMGDNRSFDESISRQGDSGVEMVARGDAGARAGTVRVTSEPAGAAISVNGTPWPELTPATLAVAVSENAGDYTLKLTRAGYQPCVRDAIRVVSGAGAEVHCELRPLMTSLTVQSKPEGARVFLDDRELGATPLRGREVVADGRRHLIELRRTGYLPISIPVVLSGDREVSVSRSLKPRLRYGYIDVYSEPWADIYLDGRKIGVAPQRRIRLPYGRHSLKLVNPVQGYERSLTVTVPATKPYRLKLSRSGKRNP